MPTSRQRRTERAIRARESLEHEWLITLARDLAEIAPDPGPAELVWMSRPPHTAAVGDGGVLALIELDADDPVAAVVGMALPPGADAVGLMAGARSRSLDDGRPVAHGRLVHLVTVNGVSVTVLPGPDQRLIAPTADFQTGRVPDVCRRLLGLGTGPVPGVDAVTVTHLWLTRLARLAALRPGLGWGSVLAAHPFVELLTDAVDEVAPAAEAGWGDDELPTFADAVHDAADGLTPAIVAGWTGRCAEQWSWAHLRRGVAAGLPDLLGHRLTAKQAEWMDDAMFARWVTGELPSPRAALDTLDATLHPGAVDRLRATISLSWRPTATGR